MALFGVKDGPGEIAVVFTGPQKEVVVRRKEKIGGVWLNLRGVDFENVPVYYDYALASPEEDIADASVLKAEQIGQSYLKFEPDESRIKGIELEEFQQGLVRNRMTEGLFPESPQPITFISHNFFRTTFTLPPNVPTGSYQIKTYLLQQGRVKDVKTMDVRVAQVGVSAGVYRFAHENPFAYSLLIVLFAMIIGWFSNVIRRRV